jgi:hypothetical protein
MNREIKNSNKVSIFSRRLILPAFILAAISVPAVIVQTTPAQPGHIQTLATIPPALKPLNSPEVYDPDNLYEKIDGQAELYLSAGFVSLKSQWFAEIHDADSMFEMYVYDMGDGLNAFSVYSVQRRDDAQMVDLAQFAYQAENALYLVHGPYYVEMISAAPSKNLLPKMTSLARNFIKNTHADSKSIQELGFFPKKNLDRGSISLISKNAFGFDGLDRVFIAAYNIDGNKVTAFVSKRKTPEEAQDLVLGLHKYYISFGAKDI